MHMSTTPEDTTRTQNKDVKWQKIRKHECSTIMQHNLNKVVQNLDKKIVEYFQKSKLVKQKSKSAESTGSGQYWQADDVIPADTSQAKWRLSYPTCLSALQNIHQTLCQFNYVEGKFKQEEVLILTFILCSDLFVLHICALQDCDDADAVGEPHIVRNEKKVYHCIQTKQQFTYHQVAASLA